MKHCMLATIRVATVFCFLLLPAMAADVEPVKNWAQELIGPIAGTSVYHDETLNYGRYKFVAGPVDKGVIKAITTIEGRTSAILYKATEKNSTFEIFSVYKSYFKKNKFEIVFAAEKKECGEAFHRAWYTLNPFESDGGFNNSYPITEGSWENMYYLAAKKNIAGKDTYVSIFINSRIFKLNFLVSP